MTLPRGWAAKIGIALRIGAVIVAAATDAGRMDDLPIPSPPTSDPGGGGTGESSPASGEWRGKVVDAVYDELASAVDAKTNDMIDSAFMEVNTDDVRVWLLQRFARRERNAYVGSEDVCMCVCFLPIHSGHQVRWTYQPGSHRRKVTQDFSYTFFLRCMP